MVEEDHRGADANGGGESRIDVPTVLRLLSDPLCRFILLQSRAEPENTVHFDDLVDRYEERVGDLDRQTLEVQCHHAHLPALQSAGVVAFDSASGAIRYYPDPLVDELLDVVERWTR